MNAPILPRSQAPKRRGFTMTELMVVIGIIAVLAGILLTAMRGVRTKAMKTQTVSTMEEFSKAADAFHLEHRHYPGVVPEQILAQPVYSGIPPISGTENALLDLMGGWRLKTSAVDVGPADWDSFACSIPGMACPNLEPSGWELRIDINRIGEGSLIDGRPNAPYFTPGESQFAVAKGQMNGVNHPECCSQIEDCPGTPVPCLPDLLDAWGQPIIYVRRVRTTGPLVGTFPVTPEPQFYMDSMGPYLQATALGKFGKNQTDLTGGSILNLAPDPLATFAQIIRHPSLGPANTGGTLTPVQVAQAGTAQGAYVLISAGPDGIYFSAKDGPGTPKLPVKNIVTVQYDATIVRQYDDIRIFGGG